MKPIRINVDDAVKSLEMIRPEMTEQVGTLSNGIKVFRDVHSPEEYSLVGFTSSDEDHDVYFESLAKEHLKDYFAEIGYDEDDIRATKFTSSGVEEVLAYALQEQWSKGKLNVNPRIPLEE